MSEEKRFEYKIKLKKLSIEHTRQLEHFAGRIGLIIGALILLSAIIINFLRG